MLRCTTRLVALLCASLALLGVLAMPASAAPGGNAGNAAACENGGYLTYTTTDGTAFKNEGQCVRYAVKGNELVLTPVARCRQEAIAANIDPTGYTIIAGTEGEDYTFTLTAGPDLICGFGGPDYVETLDAGDVFLGGAGDDLVYIVRSGGTFNGGDGRDFVYEVYGTFNGGAGADTAQTVPYGGTFIQ